MNLEQVTATHEAAAQNMTQVKERHTAATAALEAAKKARADLVAAAARGEQVKPGALAAAQAVITAAETDAGMWREAAALATKAEREALAQKELHEHVGALSAYRVKCEARAALADEVQATIGKALAGLAMLERLDLETVAALPRHLLHKGNHSPLVTRITQSLDQPSGRGIYAQPKRRDDVLTGALPLPTGADHLAEIDWEIQAAKERAALAMREGQ